MTHPSFTRRDLLRRLGIGPAMLPFLSNLPSVAVANPTKHSQRLIIVFSPDGVVRNNFWPTKPGPLAGRELPPILKPLEPFKDKILTLKGINDKVQGDGDRHMRGIGCLLTGIELFPGNVQGGSDTPAGWSSGLSIDQEIKNFLQEQAATATRFGSLEFGVLVPSKADTWTRMIYAGPNKPIAPIDDPYQMFNKLYGQFKDRQSMHSVLDDVGEDLATLAASLPAEDRRILEEHASLVRAFEKELATHHVAMAHEVPVLEQGVIEHNDTMPIISRMQIELIVASLAADFTRIASLQYTNSVGQPHMTWLDIKEGQHDLSHEPNTNVDAQLKLTKINAWYAGEVAHLAQRLADTPEPGGDGSLLDHTTILWTNELGEGNSHSLEDIPLVLVGNGLGWATGRAVQLPGVPHNRLLLSLAHAMGQSDLKRFGNPDYCGDGPLTGLT
ncbi:MAG: DUF1552 domain-containing protein [Planctomycetia bacterium]|nr:DUF1552 domain-containing protein [Planctomycetia bacterium]